MDSTTTAAPPPPPGPVDTALRCAICHASITDPAMAMALYPLLPGFTDMPRTSALFVHKGQCLDTAEHLFADAAPTEELITHLNR